MSYSCAKLGRKSLMITLLDFYNCNKLHFTLYTKSIHKELSLTSAYLYCYNFQEILNFTCAEFIISPAGFRKMSESDVMENFIFTDFKLSLMTAQGPKRESFITDIADFKSKRNFHELKNSI